MQHRKISGNIEPEYTLILVLLLDQLVAIYWHLCDRSVKLEGSVNLLASNNGKNTHLFHFIFLRRPGALQWERKFFIRIVNFFLVFYSHESSKYDILELTDQRRHPSQLDHHNHRQRHCHSHNPKQTSNLFYCENPILITLCAHPIFCRF